MLPVQSLEHAGLAILAHVIPREAAPIHRDVDTRRERLHERERAPEVEEPIGAAERVRDHGARQHDSLALDTIGNRVCRLDHRVGAVRDDDLALLALLTRAYDQRAL